MTDVEAKTPNKRKSVPGNQASAKKQKLVQTPAKNTGSPKQKPGKTPQNQQARKQKMQNGNKSPSNQQDTPSQKTPKQVQNNQSAKKQKKNSISEDASPQKVNAFAGTGEMQSKKANQQVGVKQDDGTSKKKKRRDPYFQLKQKVRAGDQSVVAALDERIKGIEGKGELSKSATKRLKLLKRMRRNLTGEKPAPQPVKNESKVSKKQAKAPKAAPKPAAPVEESEDDEDDTMEEEAESDDEVDGEEDEESDGEEEGEDEEDEEDDDDEDDDESEEEVAAPPKKVTEKQTKESKNIKTNESSWNIGVDDLKKNQLLAKNQKRYVLFVGNIPYDTNKVDLVHHFEKCGSIKHIRIPTEKKSNKPRGFAYVEIGDEETYQKCMSLHHSFLKGRRINVLYTQGGKKKGDEQKKEIKAKNFKLHAMRKQGQLSGSKKDSQKRSFRRKKQREATTKMTENTE